jgi:Domain of unknown function (DUF5050)
MPNQYNIGGNTTSSTPFVKGDWVYFRGTDDTIYRIKIDGTQQASLNNTTKSTPFAADDGFLYFQGTGTHNGLWKIAADGDGSDRINLGGNETASMPYVKNGWVTFRGTNNTIYRIKTDGTQQTNLNQETLFTPSNEPGYGDIFFCCTNWTLCFVNEIGTGFKPFGHPCGSMPYVDHSGGVVAFNSGGPPLGGSLYTCNLDGTGLATPGNNTLRGSPFIDDGWIYFQGTDNGLYRTNGTNNECIGNNSTASPPFVAAGSVYFRGTDNGLYRYEF